MAMAAEVVLATKNSFGALAADEGFADAAESDAGEGSGAEPTAHVVALSDKAQRVVRVEGNRDEAST